MFNKIRTQTLWNNNLGLLMVLSLFAVSLYGQNTPTGVNALAGVTTGNNNTATGGQALQSLTTGNDNTATGVNALMVNNASFNTANGRNALMQNQLGTENTATGYRALETNNGGNFNTAMGAQALLMNIHGTENTATGFQALLTNDGGIMNTANGSYSLSLNSSGNRNTAIGTRALFANTSGSWNTAVGHKALDVNTTGNNNTALGRGANNIGATYSNTTGLGFNADCTASNQVRIGNPGVTSIGGYVGWTVVSDGRFKVDISEDVKGLDFINSLRPVTYKVDINAIQNFFMEHYGEFDASQYDQEALLQTGFIAQEVEAAAKGTGYDFSGVDAPANGKDFYGLRYAEFVVPLTKAVQELHSENDQLKEVLQQQSELLSSLQAKNALFESELASLKAALPNQ